ncbi:MAG TPA: GAF domain-containing protein, partial [Armatimonadetes bacterium]|nr:GAF domain-containing protein [Armatimonadota bacterium]
PLMRGDEIIGALSVQSYQFDAYTDEHLQILEHLCEQVALTLDNLRLRELMRTSQEMYQILFNATPLSVAIASLGTGAVVDANETFVKTLRYSDDSEILGRHVLDFIVPECREDVRRCIENLAEGRPTPERYEVRLLCKDGSTIDVELNIVDCELLLTRYLILVAYNISERTARENELRYHITLLRAFQETLSKMSRAHNLDEALDAIGKAAMHLLEADRAAIYEVVHHPREMAHCLWSSGLSDEYIRFIEQHASMVPGQKALDMKQPRFITNVYSHPEMAILRELVKREGYHSIGIFPLVMRDEAIGALVLYYDAPHRLSRHEFEIGQAFADQLAVTLHNARLCEDALRRAEFLAARNAVMRSLLTSMNFDESAVTLFNSIRQLMPCDYISVALLDRSAQRMEIIASWSTASNAGLNKGSQLHAPITWIDSLSHQLYRYCPDLKERAHVECEIVHKLLNIGMRTCANIPIIVHGKLIGVLTVSSVASDAFTEIHIEQLREFANLVGIALQRAQLYERLQRSEALYRDLYDNAPVGYHTVDAVGIITDMNRTELEWLGYRAEEIIGKVEFCKLLTRDSQQRWHVAWQMAWQR